MQLSLFTLNTWKCDGEYPYRLDLISNELLAQEFDFLLGQEVFDSEAVSTEKILTDTLGLPSHYAKARYKDREMGGDLIRSYSGLCTWTHHSISSWHKIVLPSTDLDGERISQVFTFEENGMLIALINTHLTHLKNETSLRTKQIESTLNEVNRFCTPDGILFCGDFNAGKNSVEITTLTSTYGFTDTYPDCLSSHINGRCTDHVFYYPSNLFSVKNAAVVLNTPVDGTIPSDHFGIYVELNLHGNES